jgi:programmed cell death 6-interacting protein
MQKLTIHSEINLPPISSLSLQQQKQDENRIPRDYSTRSQDPPMPAPIPTRAPVAPMRPALGPHVGMWSPEIGIKFGGPPPGDPPPQSPQKLQGGKWDPTSGLRFG